MKKYIRTKDGVWETEEYWKRPPIEIMSLKEEIIKQADTIEELCDYFVVEYTSGEHAMFRHFCDLERHYELYTQDYHHVAGRYGAIWVTGKGLIYVAKMNEQGELELI